MEQLHFSALLMSILLRGSFFSLLFVLAFSAIAQQSVREQSSQSTTTTQAPTDDPTNTRAILAAPKVGDLYSAELSYFSGGFRPTTDESGQRTASYGMMKVIAVNNKDITVITETGAWPHAAGARNELRGDLSDITWDPDEEIKLYRAELPNLHATGKIIEARRLNP